MKEFLVFNFCHKLLLSKFNLFYKHYTTPYTTIILIHDLNTSTLLSKTLAEILGTYCVVVYQMGTSETVMMLVIMVMEMMEMMEMMGTMEKMQTGRWKGLA